MEEKAPPPDFTVASLLRELGFDADQGSLDEALRWALMELKFRREAEPRALMEAIEVGSKVTLLGLQRYL